MAACKPHKLAAAGSIPAPAPKKRDFFAAIAAVDRLRFTGPGRNFRILNITNDMPPEIVELAKFVEALNAPEPPSQTITTT